MVLGNLGLLCRDEGQLHEARPYYEAAFAIHRELGSRPFEGIVLGSLGDLLAKQGRIAEAREALQAGEALLRKGGLPPWVDGRYSRFRSP